MAASIRSRPIFRRRKSASTITFSIRAKGFSIDKAFDPEYGGLHWKCIGSSEGIDYDVEIISTHQAEQIRTLSFDAQSMEGISIVDARQFITVIAALPFSGKNAQVIQKWVKKHYSATIIDTTVGGVHFLLSAPKKNYRSLTIGQN